MTDIVQLLSTFHGRISRGQWWLGFIITFVGSVMGTLLFNAEIFTAGELPPPNWLDTFWQLAWLIPSTAIAVKRFNDRNWPWWLGYAVGLVGIVCHVAPHFGLPLDPEAGGAGAATFWIWAAILFAAFIDNGFIQGTRGPNRYGPDPLAGASQTA